jgi:hypothetical protein
MNTANPEPQNVQSDEYIHSIGDGLVAHYTFDTDIDNKTIDFVGKNNGSLFGSTVGLWRFDNNYYSPIDSTSYSNNGGLVGNTIGLWHFDENTGTTTKDETGYSNTGTLVGNTARVIGVSDNALYFDGSGIMSMRALERAIFPEGIFIMRLV